MFRIKKGQREFVAKRLDTLEKLIRKGLLEPEDPISADGAPFVPAASLKELSEAFAARPVPSSLELQVEEPWRHWDSEDGESLDEDGDALLSSFLEQIGAPLTPPSLPTLGRAKANEGAPLPTSSLPTLPALRPEDLDPVDFDLDDGSWSDESETNFPGSLGRVQHSGEDTKEAAAAVDAERWLDPAEVASGSVSQLHPIFPNPSSQHSAGPSADETTAFLPNENNEKGDASDLGRTGLGPGAEGKGPEPVSFHKWVEEKGFSESGRLLENFGKENDGILVGPTIPTGSRVRFSWVRVGVIVGLAGLGFGLWSLTVRTGAQSSFPTESELERRIPGLAAGEVLAPKAAVEESADVTPPSSEQRLLHRSRELRSRLGPNIIPFSNRLMLQDSLFQELLNSGAFPRGAEVEVLRVQGSKDKDAERPVLANVTVRLVGAQTSDPEEALRSLEDRLMLAWLVLGKYATQGKVSIAAARVEVSEPTPWSQPYDGRRLTGFWTGRIPPDAFFLEGD